MFATSAELASFTQDDSLDAGRGDLFLQSATAIIRNYCRQHLTLVTDDLVELRGAQRRRLLLPERPIVSVGEVTVDGTVVTDFNRVRDGLWRDARWGGETKLVTVTYTHGWAPGSPQLDVLRGVCLQVAARAAGNPQSLNSFGDGQTALGYGGGGTGSQVLGLTSAEQAILSRFRHEKASAWAV